MYRNEWDAAVARANALETQLRQAQSGQQQDAATIAMLTQQLAACTAELARLRGPNAAPFGATGYLYAPRAGSILTLGILSLVACTFLGPIAWSMGNTELQRIDAGQVDPSGRANVAAGRICGMIASAIMILGIVIFVIGFAVAIGNASRY